jgi:hypothetical protein
MKGLPLSASDIRSPERFWARVEQGEACWRWTGYATPSGYGMHQDLIASRVSYVLAVGPISAGLFVCHRCDNPICVRPDHLFLGTHSDNMRDAMAKGRRPHYARRKSTCSKGHPLIGDNLVARNGGRWRRCRTCMRDEARRAYAKIKARSVA